MHVTVLLNLSLYYSETVLFFFFDVHKYRIARTHNRPVKSDISASQTIMISTIIIISDVEIPLFCIGTDTTFEYSCFVLKILYFLYHYIDSLEYVCI